MHEGSSLKVRQEALLDRGLMRSMREPSKAMELLATLLFRLELPKPTTRTSGIYICSARIEGQPSLKSIVNFRAETRARQSVRTSVVVKAMESVLLLPESHVPYPSHYPKPKHKDKERPMSDIDSVYCKAVECVTCNSQAGPS